MYKYFVSFSYFTNNGVNFGNAVLESNVCITDYDDVHEMNGWILELQQYISKKIDNENVSILNYQLIKK